MLLEWTVLRALFCHLIGKGSINCERTKRVLAYSLFGAFSEWFSSLFRRDCASFQFRFIAAFSFVATVWLLLELFCRSHLFLLSLVEEMELWRNLCWHQCLLFVQKGFGADSNEFFRRVFPFSVLLLLIGPTSNCALKVIETAVKKLLWCNSWRYMWDVVETLLGWSVLLSSFSLLGFERVNGFWLSSGSTSLRLSTKPLNHAPNPKKISSN